MTWSNDHSHALGHYDATNAADTGIGPQGAALICELRRLQKLLSKESYQEREKFAHAVETRPANRPFDNRRGTRSEPTRAADHGTVNFVLNMLGLNRRKPIGYRNNSRLRGKTPVLPRRSGRQRAKVFSQPRAGRPAEGAAPPPTAAKIESRNTHQAGACSSIERPSQIYLLGRPGIPSAAETGNSLRRAFQSGLKFLRSGHAFEHLRSVCAFLISRAGATGMDETSGAGLTARLTHAFEGELKIGLRVLILGVGILGGWATLVPLSGAVVVPGTLVVESDVKKIQHPAGGVVAYIPVRDGMHVRAGDLLLRLDDTQLQANYQVLMQQLDQVRVRLARLVAERDGVDQPRMPQEMDTRLGEDIVAHLWASEISLFRSRAAARRSAKELLGSHVGQLGEQISGLDAQVKSKAAQHDLISRELEGVDSLYQKGLVPLTRKTSLEREAARLDGDRGQTTAAIAEAKSKISEAGLQAVRIDQDFRSEVMKDLREAQDKEVELVQKTVAAQDLLKRVDLRAPTNGVIHQLSVHTVGGVIAPGEVAMEIVPESDELQIEAKLPPRDIDQVGSGQRAYVRFSAFNQRTTPQLEGVVSYVSADLSHDRQANAAFYTVRVTLPSRERRRLGSLQLIAGMPVEVFLQTGSRTMMSYLLKPITDQLMRTFN